MSNVYFGFGVGLNEKDGGTNNGVNTSVAINNHNMVLEMHKSQSRDLIYYRLGVVKHATVEWNASEEYDVGVEPSCAMNNMGIAVETHKSQARDRLFCNVGLCDPNTKTITWAKKPDVDDGYDDGTSSSICINDAGIVVQVHQSPLQLWYRVGIVNNVHYDENNVLQGNIDWGLSYKYADNGEQTSIAIANDGTVIEMHKSIGLSNLWYQVGKVDIDRRMIDWYNKPKYAIKFDTGEFPSVAISTSAEDNKITAVITYNNGSFLYSKIGELNPATNTLSWNHAPQFFDYGYRSVVACNSRKYPVAIQTHQSNAESTLWYSTSLVFDRANWMGDNFEVIQNQGLRLMDITMPGSHDAPTLTQNVESGILIGCAQSLTIYEQLKYGSRFFDLRVGLSNGTYLTYHKNSTSDVISVSDYLCSPLVNTLRDISNFADEFPQEVIILSFTHYHEEMKVAEFNGMKDLINSYLGKFLYKDTITNIAAVPISRIVSSHPNTATVIFTTETMFNDIAIIADPTQGVFSYHQMTETTGPDAEANCNVFDSYAEKLLFSDMKPNQIQKFDNYTACASGIPSLFLLSWTQTSAGTIWEDSTDALSQLGMSMEEMAETRGWTPKNAAGCRINILYTDFVQQSRSTDISMYMNNFVPSETYDFIAPFLATA